MEEGRYGLELQLVEFSEKTKNSSLNKSSAINYSAIDSLLINQKTNKPSAIVLMNRLTISGPIENQFDIVISNEENAKRLQDINRFGEILKIPTFIISFTPIDGMFSWAKLSNGRIESEELLETKDLVGIIDELRERDSKKIEKPIYRPSMMDSIQTRFRKSGILLGGNIDGFSIEGDHIKLIEFSRINKDFNGSKVGAYSFQYMKEDAHRWMSLQYVKEAIMKNGFSSDIDVVVWSAESAHVKLFKNIDFFKDGDEVKFKATETKLVGYRNNNNNVKSFK